MKKLKYSLFVIIAVGDRKSRVRTAEISRFYVSDDNIKKHLKEIIPNLKIMNLV
jgi:hypothetical protein